jgi:hypothetical protein
VGRAAGVISARQRDGKEDPLQRKVRRRSNLNLGLDRPWGHVLVDGAVIRSLNRRPATATTASARATAATGATREAAAHDQCALGAGELSATSPATAALAPIRSSGNDGTDAGAEGHQLTVNPYAAQVSARGTFHLPKDLVVPAQQNDCRD